MLRQMHKSRLFFPGLSIDFEQMVANCPVCADYAMKQPSEPLKP